MKVKVTQSCLTLCGLMVYSPWNSPGQNTGVGSLFLLQGSFLTQGSNPGLLHCRRILYQLNHNYHWATSESPIRTIHPDRKALINCNRDGGPAGVWKTPVTELEKNERREGKQSRVLLQALPSWTRATGLVTTWLLTTSCLVELLPLVLWPTFSHPFKMCYLDDHLVLHYYFCHSSGWFKNSQRQVFQYFPLVC